MVQSFCLRLVRDWCSFGLMEMIFLAERRFFVLSASVLFCAIIDTRIGFELGLDEYKDMAYITIAPTR